MRHKMGYKKLNRTSEHRKALIKNMLNSLIKYEQITTTLPKAKVLKPQADKIITLGKKDTLHNTKTIISKLQNKELAKKVRNILSKRYKDRKGGYTRIIKAGYRSGDNAPVAIIEFVDRDLNAKKVDKKEKKFGIWMITESIKFSNIPKNRVFDTDYTKYASNQCCYYKYEREIHRTNQKWIKIYKMLLLEFLHYLSSSFFSYLLFVF